MKKIIISMMAVAALAACTKSEVQYEPAGEISFAPVAKNVTKSVAGYDEDGAFDGVFPTEIDLYVFANAGTGAAAAHDEEYFKNALFQWQTEKNHLDVAAGGAYAGQPTRYWPNVKTLVFAGYSDACGLDTTTPEMDFEQNVLTIPSYTQNNEDYELEGENDLMWFPCDNEAYSKQTNEVVAQMKHACSWITINVAGDATTSGNWILNSLVLKNLAHTGKVECGLTAATWSSFAAYDDEDYYNAQTTEDFNPAEGTEFTTALKEYYKTEANNFIVIPQEPVVLEVTYSYESDTNITFSETKQIPLDYDGVDGTNTAWVWGTHYIYNITITASEILIDPVVVDWTNGGTYEKEIQ